MSAHITLRPWSLSRALAQVLLLTLIPVGTALAQPYGFVRVTHDKTRIECFARQTAVCMTAPQGTVLEVLYVDGDRYNHRKSNRYWILLPADQWGRRVTGWIRGSAVEHVPAPPGSRSNASLTDLTRELDAPHESRETPVAAPAPAPVEKVPAVRAAIPDVVLHFEFGKSALTDEARRTLESAIVKPASNVQGLTIALEGHADWIGTEAYNDRLGLARAETVKRYLTQQGFPIDRISVVSYGKREPVAPNTTRQGRAQIRRVVIKSGGGS